MTANAAVARQTRPDGAELLYRPTGPASAQNPAYSPDGATLLFTLFPDGYNLGGAGLNLLRTPGGGAEELLRQGDQAAVNLPGSAWNGPTGLITFSFDSTDRDEIWTIRRGELPRRITEHDGTRGYTEPSFSPDGTWIVFQENSSQTGTDPRGSLWKVRADRTAPTVLLVHGPAAGTDNRQPNWSPRGDLIVFQSRTGTSANWDLITIAPDGGNRSALLDSTDEDTDASFSPDGSWVVYSSDRAGAPHAQLFITRSDRTGTPHRITTSTQYDGAPSWSPDGRWIAFESGPDGESATSLWRIPVRILGS